MFLLEPSWEDPFAHNIWTQASSMTLIICANTSYLNSHYMFLKNQACPLTNGIFITRVFNKPAAEQPLPGWYSDRRSRSQCASFPISSKISKHLSLNPKFKSKTAVSGAGAVLQCYILQMAALLPIQLLVSAPGKAAGDSLSPWAPAIHLADPEGTPGSWFGLAQSQLLLPFRNGWKTSL